MVRWRWRQIWRNQFFKRDTMRSNHKAIGVIKEVSITNRNLPSINQCHQQLSQDAGISILYLKLGQKNIVSQSSKIKFSFCVSKYHQHRIRSNRSWFQLKTSMGFVTLIPFTSIDVELALKASMPFGLTWI